MNENDISYVIRGAIFRVYNNLGPGLLESVYVAALIYELENEGMEIRANAAVPVFYGGEKLDPAFRIDILVNELVLIEVKSVEQLAKVYHKQVITYLKLSGLKLGLLVNFNTDDIQKSIFRKVNGL